MQKEKCPATGKAAQMGSLVIYNKVFPLYQGLNLIGRHQKATVILKNENISQHQAIITIIDENQHYISDVFSSNGTTLGSVKLQPLKIYALEQDNTIEFSNVIATYKKVSGPHEVSKDTLHHENGNLESTQNVDDSFYLATTQEYHNIHPCEPISSAHHNGFFDDGYDFNNLPSPPNVTIISPQKRELTIHEMPTQVFEWGNIGHEIELTTARNRLTIHDLPTQLMFDTATPVSKSLPNNMVIDQVQKVPVRSPSLQSIHFAPTQMPNQLHNSMDDSIIPQTQESPVRNDNEQLDVTNEVVDETVINDSRVEACTSKTDIGNRSSLTLIECTPSEKKFQKGIVGNSLESDISQEIGRKRKKCRPLDDLDSEVDSDNRNSLTQQTPENQRIGFLKKKCKPLETDSESDNDLDSTQEIGYKKKTVSRIVSDTDMEHSEDTSNIKKSKGSSIEQNQSSELVLSNNIQTEHKDSSKVESDSDTDIEREDCDKANSSGSETDIDLDLITDKTDQTVLKKIINEKDEIKRSSKKRLECVQNVTKNSSYDETLLIQATMCSDEDSEDFNFMTEKAKPNVSCSISNSDTQGSVLDVSQQLEKLRQTTVASNNCSEESIHFCLTEVETTDDTETVTVNSTTSLTKQTVNAVDKVNTDSKEQAKNTSAVKDKEVNYETEKLLEKCTNEVVDDIFLQPTQVCQIESDHNTQELRESDGIVDKSTRPLNSTILSKSNKVLQTNVISDDIYMQATQVTRIENDCDLQKLPEIFDKSPSKLRNSNELMRNANKIVLEKCANEALDDIFQQATQACHFGNAKAIEKIPEDDDEIFDKPTQALDLPQPEASTAVENSKAVFLQKECSKSNVFTPDSKKSSSFATSTPAGDDDIFLLATQKVNLQDDQLIFKTPQRTSLPKLQDSHNIEDIFLQPTQEIPVEKPNNDEDDIFLQPTQELPVSNNKNKCSIKRLAINQEIFINPGQQLCLDVMTNDTEDAIFLQPTQAVIVSNLTLNKECGNVGIEEVPTQKPVLDEDLEIGIKQQDDIFLQETQAVQLVEINKNAGQTLALLCNNNGEEEESQLEVTFASQTVKFCSPTNTRPQNPLANILEKSDDQEEETQLLDALDKNKELHEVESGQHKTNKLDEEDTLSNKLIKSCSNTSSNKKQTRSEIDGTSIKNSPASTRKTRYNNAKKQNVSSHNVSPSKNDKNETEVKVINQLNSKKNPNKNKKEISKSAVEVDDNNTKTNNKGRTDTDSSKQSKHVQIILSSEDVNSTHDVQPAPSVETPKKDSFKSSMEADKSEQQNLAMGKKKINKRETKNKSDKSAPKKDELVRKLKTDLDLDIPVITPENCDSTSKTKLAQIVKSSRTVRGKCKKVEFCQEETPPTRENHNTENKTTMTTRRTRRKQNTENDENVSTKKSKPDHVSETPLVHSNITVRKRRKIDFDLEDEDTNLNTAVEKPVVDASIVTVSSTESSETTPSASKRRKQVEKTDIPTKQVPLNKNNEIKSKITQRKDTSNLSVISTPERLRRIQKPRVVFTMLDDSKLESIIRALGGTIVDTVKSCTVLVTGNLKRSQKLLSAIGEAKPICGPDWLLASKKAGAFLDPWDHLLNDAEAEAKWKFTLKESLTKSTNKKLLSKHSFHILTTAHLDVLKAAIEACGGKLLTRVPAKHPDNNIIIISTPENKTKYSKFLQHKPPLKVVASEAIFDGVLRQELHWDDHLLL